MKQDDQSLLKIEQDVIGALFCDGADISGAIEIVTPEDFSVENNKAIFKVVCEFSAAGQLVDFVTVGAKTQMRSYIIECMDKIEIGSRLIEYAKILREKSLRRNLTDDLKGFIKQLSDGVNPAIVMDSLQQRLFEIDKNQLASMRWISEIKEEDFTQSAGVATGFADLSWLKLERGAMIVVGGRPSMGKTALCLKIGLNVAQANVPVLIYSMEMSFKQIVHRLASMDCKSPLVDIRNGYKRRSDFDKTLSKPILVDDSGTITPTQLRSRTRTAIQKHNIGLVIIDYLQMMSSASQSSEYERITEISGGIKSVAKDLNIPILVACQLNRMIEDVGAKSKKPTMANLRGSGAIEQDADIVIFPYRPHVYDKAKHNATDAEIIVGKNRNGQTSEGVEVVWLSEFALFESLIKEGVK